MNLKREVGINISRKQISSLHILANNIQSKQYHDAKVGIKSCRGTTCFLSVYVNPYFPFKIHYCTLVKATQPEYLPVEALVLAPPKELQEILNT